MKPLTDAARLNVESGAVDGPGTMVCRKCGGPKEESRINSSQCRTCQRQLAQTKPRLVFTTTPEIATVIEAQAAIKGVGLNEYLHQCMRRILLKDTGVDIGPIQYTG